MKFRSLFYILLHFFSIFYTRSSYSKSVMEPILDTIEVNNLNKLGFDSRLTDAEQTILYGERALKIAKKINYLNGIAEAYRVKGIGLSYLDKSEIAIENYLNAMKYFKRGQNSQGEAKVYNNIGNLYMDGDFDRALEYYNKSLTIAKKLNIESLLASIYGSLGNIYQRKKNYYIALANYQKSVNIFKKINNPVGITQGLQNIGVAFFNLNQINKAEEYLVQAINEAIENDLNNIIARSNITLASIYIQKSDFLRAKNSILQGITYSKIVKDLKLEYEYLHVSYKLEYKQKNYKSALNYLEKVYTRDSTIYENNISTKVNLIEKQYQQTQKQKANELTIAQQKYSKTLYWASTIVAGLSLIVIFLLFRNIKKTTQTNKILNNLNQEVLLQKENLSQVNQNLEQVIEHRTHDLQIKNKKLSEYSSHLSHEIRSPISTLKGLLILEEGKMIEHEELVQHLHKCVSELDNKIININEMLNNPNRPGLVDELEY